MDGRQLYDTGRAIVTGVRVTTAIGTLLATLPVYFVTLEMDRKFERENPDASWCHPDKPSEKYLTLIKKISGAND